MGQLPRWASAVLTLRGKQHGLSRAWDAPCLPSHGEGMEERCGVLFPAFLSTLSLSPGPSSAPPPIKQSSQGAWEALDLPPPGDPVNTPRELRLPPTGKSKAYEDPKRLSAPSQLYGGGELRPTKKRTTPQGHTARSRVSVSCSLCTIQSHPAGALGTRGKGPASRPKAQNRKGSQSPEQLECTGQGGCPPTCPAGCAVSGAPASLGSYVPIYRITMPQGHLGVSVC